MKKGKSEELHTDLSNLTIPAFGYELIREIFIPDLLGKETKSILYLGGKNLARHFPLQTLEEIMNFFVDAGWGKLELVAEKKDSYKYELSSELIKKRLTQKKECTFQLEAGFLAEQIQRQQGYITEAFEEQNKKSPTVSFTVKWDRLDKIDNH